MKKSFTWYLLTGSLIVFFFFSLQTAQAQSNKGPSPADCEAYAKNVAANYVPGGALGGAARGAAGGALFGAVIGGSKHAKRGAILGGAVGGARNVMTKEEIRRQAYNECMAGKAKW